MNMAQHPHRAPQQPQSYDRPSTEGLLVRSLAFTTYSIDGAPEAVISTMLERMIQSGEVHTPALLGMPDWHLELAENQKTSVGALIAERDRERQRCKTDASTPAWTPATESALGVEDLAGNPPGLVSG